MSTAGARQPGARGWGAVRVIVVADFLLLGLCVLLDMAGGSAVDRALRKAGVDNVAALSLQLWIVFSTVLATGFFAWEVGKSWQDASAWTGERRSVAIDGALLLAWWLTILALCVYGFLLGMAG